MFRVKICGITNVEDAIAAVEAGADAIGLNFYEKSPRLVSPDNAMQIARTLKELPPRRSPQIERSDELAFILPARFEVQEPAIKSRGPATVVGVFVNLERAAVQLIAESLALSAIQFHGDEEAETVAHFAKPIRPESHPYRWCVIRARRMDDRGVASIAADLEHCRKAGWPPAAVLVDAMTPGRYGGTGETVSWVGLADHKRWLGEVPLILAGGLTPDNVAEAIRIVRPAAVDVASGVESSPGKKDPAKVRDFVANALGAFEGLGT
jgi:phosphoribosylanthranilate isomerase